MDNQKITKCNGWPIDVAGLTICLVFALVMFLTMIRPLIQQASARIEQEKTLASKQDQASQASAILKSLHAQKAKLAIALAQSPLTLQSADTINQRLASLNTLAGKSQLQVHSVKPGRLIAGSQFGTVPILLKGTGRYADCVQFLHQIHQVYADMAVDSLKLVGNPTKQAAQVAHDAQAIYQFNLLWYTSTKDD